MGISVTQLKWGIFPLGGICPSSRKIDLQVHVTVKTKLLGELWRKLSPPPSVWRKALTYSNEWQNNLKFILNHAVQNMGFISLQL